MNDLIISTIRTMVPSFIGILIALLSDVGITIDEPGVAGLTAFAMSLTIGAYYLGVRLVAKRYPQLEWLVGWNKKPEYVEPVREI